jgi:hypothetical protein
LLRGFRYSDSESEGASFVEVKLKLPKWQLAFLRQLSRERGVSLSDVVRDLILQEKLRQQAS